MLTIICRSDGAQPHYVNIQWNQRVNVSVSTVTESRMLVFYFSCQSCRPPQFMTQISVHLLQELHLYADFKGDESYTPSKVSIRAGNAIHDLRVRPCTSNTSINLDRSLHCIIRRVVRHQDSEHNIASRAIPISWLLIGDTRSGLGGAMWMH